MPQGIRGDGVSPDLDAQQRTQAAQTAGLAGGVSGGVSTGTVRETDIAEGERVTMANLDHEGIIFANTKRTYDEYQQESLEGIRVNRQLVNRQAQNAVDHDGQLRNLSVQALQNAVETSNMIGKQAVRHGDIAIDGQWNPVQQGAGDAMLTKAVQLDDASVKAIAAALAAAFAETVKKS